MTAGEEAAGAAGAASWLERISGNREARAAEVRAAILLLNRALGAFRAGAADPLVQDVAATRALAIRIGYASGEELTEGRWSEARELPAPRRGRLDDVGATSRVAAVLAGRDEVHPAETLLLRARLDLEMGREPEARYGLRAARGALEAEPPDDGGRIAEALAELEGRL
ncbi:MAG: hypothetical protein ACXWZW_04365 [Solirubrobacterales bacterium]